MSDYTKNSNPTAPHALEGERGLPGVNQAKPNTINRRLIGLFFAGALLVTLGFAYLSYTKSHKPQKQETPKNLQITNAVPGRTFELPKQSKASTEKIKYEGSTSHDAMNNSIDKSASALMTSKEKAGGGQYSGMPGSLDYQSGNGNVGGTSASSTTAMKGGSTPVGDLLNATPTPLQSASVLKNRDYLVAKGSFIDCVLQTRLDTTVPGMTSCVVTRNIYGDTGKVLLVERGSKVSGEYQSNMKQGQARIFVLWNRIKTPSGIVISLDSPGSDSLGGSGIPGYVDTHFWQRFGGAIMLSLIQDAGEVAANALAQNTGTAITLNNTSGASQTMAVEALRNSINIPPTLYKNQGDRIGIYVARDLDFKTVYDLKPE